MYNNPLQTSHTPSWHAAVDRINLALQITWNDYLALRSRLHAVKESAGHKGETHHKGVEHIQFGPYLVRVSPAGSRKGISGPFFAFVIDYEDIFILIQDNALAKNECPNVLVEIGGRACLDRGEAGALNLAQDIIRQAGGELESEALSRIDFSLDMPGVGMDEFARATQEGRYIMRSKRYKSIESNGMTLEFGRSPLQLAIYDKRAEVMSMRNAHQKALMVERRWGGSVPAQAIRVEFRVWRKKLRDFGIGKPDDGYIKRRALVEYLCRDWFRFTAGPVDRRNTSRAGTLPLWEQVHAAFAAWAGEPNGEVLEPLPPGAVDVEKLVRQSYGLAKSIARHRGMKIVPYREYEEALAETMW